MLNEKEARENAAKKNDVQNDSVSSVSESNIPMASNSSAGYRLGTSSTITQPPNTCSTSTKPPDTNLPIQHPNRYNRNRVTQLTGQQPPYPQHYHQTPAVNVPVQGQIGIDQTFQNQYNPTMQNLQSTQLLQNIQNNQSIQNLQSTQSIQNLQNNQSIQGLQNAFSAGSQQQSYNIPQNIQSVATINIPANQMAAAVRQSTNQNVASTGATIRIGSNISAGQLQQIVQTLGHVPQQQLLQALAQKHLSGNQLTLNQFSGLQVQQQVPVQPSPVPVRYVENAFQTLDQLNSQQTGIINQLGYTPNIPSYSVPGVPAIIQATGTGQLQQPPVCLSAGVLSSALTPVSGLSTGVLSSALTPVSAMGNYQTINQLQGQYQPVLPNQIQGQNMYQQPQVPTTSPLQTLISQLQQQGQQNQAKVESQGQTQQSEMLGSSSALLQRIQRIAASQKSVSTNQELMTATSTPVLQRQSSQVQSSSASELPGSCVSPTTIPAVGPGNKTVVRIFLDGKPVAVTTDPEVLADKDKLLAHIKSSSLVAGTYNVSVSGSTVKTNNMSAVDSVSTPSVRLPPTITIEHPQKDIGQGYKSIIGQPPNSERSGTILSSGSQQTVDTGTEYVQQRLPHNHDHFMYSKKNKNELVVRPKTG